MRRHDGWTPTNFHRHGSIHRSAARFGSLTPTIARVSGSDYPYPSSPIGWLPSRCLHCEPVATRWCVVRRVCPRLGFPNALRPSGLSRTKRRRGSDGTDVQGERSARHHPIGTAGRDDLAARNAAAPDESTNETPDS